MRNLERVARVAILASAAMLAWAAPIAARQAADPLTETGQPAADEQNPLAQAKDLVREGKYSEATEILDGLVDPDSDDAGLLALYGEVLVAADHAERAVPALERALELEPERVRLNFQLGTALTQLGKSEPAVEAFGREMDVNDDPEIRFFCLVNRSFLLERERRWDDAAGELERAVELRPDNVDVYGDLARLYLTADRLDDATGALDRGEAAGFRSADLYFNLGARMYNEHRYEQAEKTFRKALEIRPDMAEAERSLGSTLSQLGRTDEALDHLGRYLELKPEAPDADEIQAQLKAAGRS